MGFVNSWVVFYGDGVSLTDRLWWTRVFEYRASSGTGLVRRQFQNKKGIKAAIKRDNPGVEDLTTVPRYARVRDGWIMVG